MEYSVSETYYISDVCLKAKYSLNMYEYFVKEVKKPIDDSQAYDSSNAFKGIYYLDNWHGYLRELYRYLLIVKKDEDLIKRLGNPKPIAFKDKWWLLKDVRDEVFHILPRNEDLDSSLTALMSDPEYSTLINDFKDICEHVSMLNGCIPGRFNVDERGFRLSLNNLTQVYKPSKPIQM